MKARAITADAALVAQRKRESLAKRDAAIFDGVMRVHFEVAFALEPQIHRCVLRKEREHVVEERNAGFNFGFAAAVKVEADGNFGFRGVARNGCLPDFHAVIESNRRAKNKAQLWIQWGRAAGALVCPAIFTLISSIRFCSSPGAGDTFCAV